MTTPILVNSVKTANRVIELWSAGNGDYCVTSYSTVTGNGTHKEFKDFDAAQTEFESACKIA